MDPLISSQESTNNDFLVESAVEQTLGGKTYRIDTSQLAIKMSKKNPLWKKALKTSAMIVATPLMVPAVFLYSLSMYLGPSWWKHKVTAAMVNAFMKVVADLFDEERQELLLQGIGPNDWILDLGAGAGHYLPYLSQGGHVVAIEPCSLLHDHYKARAIEAGMKESQFGNLCSRVSSEKVQL